MIREDKNQITRYAKKQDLTGKVFGNLEVIEKNTTKSTKNSYWRCKCKCGKECSPSYSELVRHTRKSCGCIRKPKAAKNLVGLNFPNFEVIKTLDYRKVYNKMTLFYLCKCKQCGDKVERSRVHITSKFVKSCGCLYSKHRSIKTDIKPINALYGRYWNNAVNRDLEFELTKDEFEHLVTQDCFYCGQPPSQILGRYTKFPYTGIDRIQNEVGYIMSNCVACCTMCNTMKMNLSQSDFIRKSFDIANNLRKKGI